MVSRNTLYLVLQKIPIKLLQCLQTLRQVLGVNLCIERVHICLAQQVRTNDVKPGEESKIYSHLRVRPEEKTETRTCARGLRTGPFIRVFRLPPAYAAV